MRRLVLLLTTTCLAVGALTVPAGAVPQAPTTGPVLEFEQEGNLVRSSPDGRDQTIVTQLDDAEHESVDQLRASQDGSRFTYVLSTGTGDQVVVRDASGRQVSVVEDLPTDDGYIVQPTLSPDGSTVIWARSTLNGGDFYAAPASGGPARLLPGTSDIGDPTVLDEALDLMVINEHEVVETLRAGVAEPVTGLPQGIIGFDLSPDRSTVIYQEDANDVAGRATWTAPLTEAADGTFSAGPSTKVLDETGEAEYFSFSPDGKTVYWEEHKASCCIDDDIYSMPITGGTPTDLTNNPTVLESGVVSLVLDDGTPPGPLTTAPALLAGTVATLHWTLPTDSDLSGVILNRTYFDAPPESVFVPAPLTSFRDTGLVVYGGYRYTLTTVDRSGNVGDNVIQSLTATSPTITFADPTSAGSPIAPFRVSFGYKPIYTVSVRTNGIGDFVRWVTHSTTPALIYGKDGGTVSHPGDSYQFRLQYFDAYGNATAVVIAGTAVVPIDQNSMTFTGATQHIGARVAFLGTERLLAKGSTARFSAYANRIQVIGATCSACGTLGLYVDGALVATVDTHSSGRVDKVTLLTRALRPGTHAVVLKALTGNAIIDGAAMRH